MMRWCVSLLLLWLANADRWRGVNGTCPGTAFKRQTASNVEQCKRRCEALPACQGVSYDRQNQNCAFLAGTEVSPEAVAPETTETPRCFNQHHVEVFVMMPLDLVSMDGQLQEDQLPAIWAALATSKADGFMVDVWWGITEPEPKKYNFAPYRRLIDEAKSRGFKVQIVSSFHQCGGNVGDACNIPLPEFVRSLPDIWYKDAEGKETKEYISLFADAVPLADQRTPLKMYGDWFKAFRKEFKKELKGEPIVEIMVGLGPCGEMRYPSYPLDRWSFPGIGAFQSFDVHALKSLRTAAQNETFMPPHVNYNDFPQDTSFFSLNHPSNYVSATGHFFLDWYSAALKQHGTDVISIAQKIFKKVRLAAKISGIHWWYQSPSHAAEVTAGYYNTNFHNAYLEIAQVLKNAGAEVFDFTCLEMRDSEQPEDAHSGPEELVRQSQAAAEAAGLHFAGENALQRYDQSAYDQMLVYKENLFALTYLRMTEALMQPENLQRFRCFVFAMHGDQSDCAIPDNRQSLLKRSAWLPEVKKMAADITSLARCKAPGLWLIFGRSSSKSLAVDATLSNRSGSHSRTSSHSTGRTGSKTTTGRTGSKTTTGRTGSKTNATLPFEEFRLRRRSSGGAALAEFLTSGHHGPASPVADSSKPLGKTLQRRATMPTLDVSSEALVLSRQLHLDFHEVKSAMKEIREGRHLPNGGMDEVAWRHSLSRIFGIDVEEKLLRESYAACQVAEGPVDAKLFMTWYRDHIFKIEAHKKKSQEGDELTMELAKKHGCSYTDLTKVRLKFDAYDLDKSGVIEFLEFEHMIHQLLHCTTRSDLPKNRIQRFWHEIDRDQNGSVDFQEFTDWYMKYFATAKQDGPIEAFYASFMPDFQRSHTLEALQEAIPAH